ncbi:hypothetical protein OKS80_08485 [Aeromonas veronii]|uniref:hypothetical protein n=1 Tax=Aeromonas veronii TaxID=654 RepID=UPI00226CC745|nr:hypothetical protein [Aeromonas veronii]MCX9112935.1 hypothetical protein [Aeromonas veronii]
MCFLCGNDISLHSYNSLHEALSNMQNSYEKLNEKYEKSINELNEKNFKYLQLWEELEDTKLEERRRNEESDYIPGLSSKLSEPNIFSIIKRLISHLNLEYYTLNESDKLDDDFHQLKINILNDLEKSKFTDIKIIRLRQRQWDQGKPIQLGITIDVDYLSKDEVDVLHSLVKNNHSENVRVDDMDAGHMSVYLKNNFRASISFDFGLFGSGSTPSISFFTDVYNECWEDERKANDEDETYFMAPVEIIDLLSRLNLEVIINRWSNLLSTQ